MSREEYKKEIIYQITMKQADLLLKNKVLDKEDYQEFKDKMLKKYEPKLSKYMSETLDK
ncbi:MULTISPECIES: SHOCT domain-containing protein [unclassified Gemella]|uniref:SHOCT domain-containing protein n=1 Tax=unclassified Gemella TaxID=2624949 RepID=UPI0015D00163|nr:MULTISPECIES: SHOCT domain-containing protein [unclassified Gemella]MBF0710817.1 hypothetical protein [Gemella sp. GL1.1]NYS28161.1 hypothetical protein [Gemella sp. GL1]